MKRQTMLLLLGIAALMNRPMTTAVQAEITKAEIHYAERSPIGRHPASNERIKMALGDTVGEVDTHYTGKWIVYAAKGKSLDYKSIIRGMAVAGFDVRCVQFAGTGKVVERDGKPTFAVSGTTDSYALEKGECPVLHHKAHHGDALDELVAKAKASPDKVFSVTGCVGEGKKKKGQTAPVVLHVLEFEAK